MILTGKAAEYAEGFEYIAQTTGYKVLEMTEDDQIHLFHLMRMFEMDERFKGFMKICLQLYTEKIFEGKDAMLKMLTGIGRL